MNNIRYVCLSDLHFGAQNSLLSELPGLTFAVLTLAYIVLSFVRL